MKMTTHNRGEQTRQLILDKATELFTQGGYNHTSLSQILRATGLAKGGFYFHFESKEELGEAVIRRVEEFWTKGILPNMNKCKNAREKLDCLLSAPGDCSCKRSVRPAILLLNLATEMIEVNEKFANMLQGIFTGWRRMVETIIDEGKSEQLFRKDIDSKAVAAIILSNILGANLLALLNHNTSMYRVQLRTLNKILLEGISNNRGRRDDKL
jgi:AcrR family transcriptional regulator